MILKKLKLQIDIFTNDGISTLFQVLMRLLMKPIIIDLNNAKGGAWCYCRKEKNESNKKITWTTAKLTQNIILIPLFNNRPDFRSNER